MTRTPAAKKPSAGGATGLLKRLSSLPLWQRALVWLVCALVVIGVVVLLARLLRATPAVQDFLESYPGGTHPPAGTPEGFPGWLRWTHFLNFFFMVLIVRSGLRVRTVQRPAAFWTPKRRGRGKTPPKKISLDLWFHQSIDVLWLANGLVFVVLLFASGQWARIVPTSWDVFPNALSAGLQYASLDWPLEDGWVSYNALQVLAYFVTVFIAAPLAALSGWRMSGLFPSKATGLGTVLKLQWARAVHFPVMLYFVIFVIVHVVLVLSTGALRNLNHMFLGVNAGGWAGFWIFVIGLAVTIGVMEAARPVVLRPIASLMGKVSRN